MVLFLLSFRLSGRMWERWYINVAVASISSADADCSCVIAAILLATSLASRIVKVTSSLPVTDTLVVKSPSVTPTIVCVISRI